RAALAATGTHRGHPDAATTALQLVDERGHHARAGRGDGMAQTATASGEVHQLLVDAVFTAGRDRHRRERLVDLPKCDVFGLQAGGVATRELVDAEVDDRAVELLDLHRDDLVEELALVDRRHRTLMRPCRPRVHLTARDADLLRGVPADCDRHVLSWRIRCLR